MKRHLSEFLHRGLIACCGGPIVLAIIYACQAGSPLSALTASKQILTITLLAFIAGGITVVYQIERLALFPALLIHGVVLYLDYLLVYLFNGWLAAGVRPLMIFTACFIAGYAVIWLLIYLGIQRKTKKLNDALSSQ